jgi:ubiquitin C-terminal hydrolase
MKYNLNRFNELLFSNSYFKRFEQYDAHEFLLKFMDMFENECKDIYVGQTRLTIKCTKCGNTKDVFEDFTTLNLTVNDLSEKVLDIHELFANYLKKELINDSDNLYYCDKCKTNTPSEQKTVLFKLPKRLIVIFKRYSDSGVKIDKKIKYPIDSMLVKETKSGVIFNYSLTNLIYHFGNLNNGHYLNSSKINDKWYLIDDNHITTNSEVIIDNVNSYILFYSIN